MSQTISKPIRLIPTLILTFIQQISVSLVNIVDNFMLATFGALILAGFGLAFQVIFFVYVLQFAISSSINIFIAQFNGAKNTQGISHSFAIGALGALLIMLVCMIIIFHFSYFLLSLLSSNPTLIHLAQSYLVIFAISMPFSALAYVFYGGLRSLGFPIVGVVAGLVSLGIKILLNYVFIYGNFGFPALGIQGAAYASVIANICQFLVVFIFIYINKKSPAFLTWKNFKTLRLSFVLHLIKVSWPVLMSDILWVLAFTLSAKAFLSLGVNSFANYTIIYSFFSLFDVLFFSLAYTSAIFVGFAIGTDDEKKAKKTANLFIIILAIIATVLCVSVISASPWLIHFYNVPDKIALQQFFWVLGFIIFYTGYQTLFLMGVFRAGGDTRFAFILDICTTWVFSIPVTFIGAYVFHMPIQWLFLLARFSEAIPFCILVIPRMTSGKWIKNITHIPGKNKLKPSQLP